MHAPQTPRILPGDHESPTHGVRRHTHTTTHGPFLTRLTCTLDTKYTLTSPLRKTRSLHTRHAYMITSSTTCHTSSRTGTQLPSTCKHHIFTHSATYTQHSKAMYVPAYPHNTIARRPESHNTHSTLDTDTTAGKATHS